MKKISPRKLFLLSPVLLLLSCGGRNANEQSDTAQLSTPEDTVDYLALGQEYAAQTQSVLGKNLMQAIQSEGSAHAVDFCNTRAYPLTDSMAQVLNVHLKRVSDQPRNPDNAADGSQLQYIKAGKEKLAQGGKVSPQLQEFDGKMIAYYPIITNTMCLQCHGDPNRQINQETLAKLNTLYPEDQAKGYAENQLRGIWVVEMDKE
ncbi:hypothetical protein OKW21_000317 [Catalinimonas alkaloidigena]|uniref:Tll0287-like domain-containing protein n=1 Tax=Catalinimonas alkaloidigena TaxID=1075417 RepID=UPI0024074692|nr:DUF3365 domain-containing protein [Catalinimonas alkaloidigena]MDF9795054.1 hypothetical protein [Catalinimonas alkaloidigena]